MRTAFALTAILSTGLALPGCGSDSNDTVTVQNTVTERTVTEEQTTTATTGATATTPPGPVETFSSFRSPTGNIGCVMGSGSVRCDLSERDWSPPPSPPGCNLDYGQGAEVSTAGGHGHLVCAGDTALNPSAPALAYGRVTARGGLHCLSRETGMTCTDTATDHGFFISRQSYRLF